MKTGLIGAFAVLSLTILSAEADVPGIPPIGYHGPTGAYKGDTVVYETRSFQPQSFGGGVCATRNALGVWSYTGFSIARVDFEGARDPRGAYRALVCTVKFTAKGTWRVGTNFKIFNEDGSVSTHTFIRDVSVI